MNRHFYGEGHGPSVDILSYTTRENALMDDAYGVVVDESWRARIINDELYLETRVQVYQEHGRQSTFLEYLTKEEPRTSQVVCPHIGLGGVLELFKIPTLQQSRSDADHIWFNPVATSLKSCSFCFTDYVYNVERRPLDSSGPKGWVISLTKWHRPGRCRQPNDIMWTSCEKRSSSVHRKNDAGEVYRTWMKYDDGNIEYTNGETGQGLIASFHENPLNNYWDITDPAVLCDPTKVWFRYYNAASF
jgi:hypothetical protein